jgi:hypothetical protein
MTVAVTIERLQRGYALIAKHCEMGLPAPTNYQLAIAIGMGQQRFQPHHRVRGVGTNGGRWRKPEAGTVIVRALEILGRIEVQRIGRNRRTIRIVEA